MNQNNFYPMITLRSEYLFFFHSSRYQHLLLDKTKNASSEVRPSESYWKIEPGQLTQLAFI